MNYICTWFCADEVGEESLFPQTGKRSSSKAHQDIYWRCVTVFFISSKRFNKEVKHVLFTNVNHLPIVDGIDIAKVLESLEVNVVVTPFEYKTPKGYYQSFQNQFYEFSILKHIAANNNAQNDQYMILDSDCLFIKSAAGLFKEASETGSLSYAIYFPENHPVLGLSRAEMKALFEEFLGRKIDEFPSYHMGEFFLSSVRNIQKFFHDFEEIWPKLLEKNKLGLKKFNEEAHTLSYIYFKNGLQPGQTNSSIKRIWTNPVHYRNVEPSDVNLTIWHLPAEKPYGFKLLFHNFLKKTANFGLDIPNKEYLQLVRRVFSIPYIRSVQKGNYYLRSYTVGLRNLIFDFSMDRLLRVSKKLIN